MALSDIGASTIVAVVVGGATSYLVAKVTAKSTVESAVIGATVEREKLAHSRETWRASRRDKVLGQVRTLNEHMEIVASPEIVSQAREEVALQARTSLEIIVFTLQDEAVDNHRVDELLEALRLQDLKRAVEIWADVRSSIMAGKLV